MRGTLVLGEEIFLDIVPPVAVKFEETNLEAMPAEAETGTALSESGVSESDIAFEQATTQPI